MRMKTEIGMGLEIGIGKALLTEIGTGIGTVIRAAIRVRIETAIILTRLRMVIARQLKRQ